MIQVDTWGIWKIKDGWNGGNVPSDVLVTFAWQIVTSRNLSKYWYFEGKSDDVTFDVSRRSQRVYVNINKSNNE